MKILFVITLAELGGAQSVVINLANTACEKGHEVFVVSSSDGKMWELLNKQVNRIPIESLERSINIKDFKVFFKLKRLYRNIKPDVVHLHSSKIGVIGRLAFPSNKVIYTIHGFDSIRLSHRKFLFLEKCLQYLCKYIVTVSYYDQTNLATEGIKSNVSVIYNGIPDYYNSEVEIKSKIEKFNILSIARLSPPKRFDLYKDLAKSFSGSNVYFSWAGNKESVNNLPENLQLLGEVSQAHKLLRDVNLNILISDFEGLPISIIEALCYGVPVLASNVGGISEILNGENGFALENNPDCFHNEINKFSDGTYDLLQFSKNARKSYEEFFTVEQMYNKYEVLYYKICNTL